MRRRIRHTNGRVARFGVDATERNRRQRTIRVSSPVFQLSAQDGFFQMPPVPQLGFLRVQRLDEGGFFASVLALQRGHVLGVLRTQVVEFALYARHGFLQFLLLAVSEDLDAGFVECVHGLVVVVLLFQLLLLLLREAARGRGFLRVEE